MVLKSRRTGARNWARGIFAFFWIILGGFSSLYLFTLFTDPAALGAPTIQLSAITGGTPAIPSGEGPLSAADTERLKDSLRAMSKQMAAIDTRLQSAEDYVAPVAALPAPADPPAAEPAQEPDPVEEVAVEETEVVEAAPEPVSPEPEAPPPVVTAASPAPEPEPAAPAPVAAAPRPPVTVDAPVVFDPPAVVAAPMAPEPEPDTDNASDTAAEAPAPAEEVEIAAFDPVTLPQTANDGSTRYGIEIGTVSKRNDLRPLWREFLTKHAALVAGLQPRRVLAPDKKWRLIAGPFANAQDAEGACSLFKKADRPCAATVYAGDAL